MAEQRKHHRVPISFQVTCVQDDANSFEGVVQDVSFGGLFIETDRSLAFGTKLIIVAKGLAARELRLPAIVRWAEPHGLGVQFDLLGAYATHVIVDLVKKHSS